MMSFKLALRNVKNSFRDYAIYFLTITFGVCLFYVFNSIDSQRAMMELSLIQEAALVAMNEIMGIASVLVSIIFGFLILYANRFMVRRRKKELGIYMTLGMAKGQISRILILETVLVGVLSLAVGLALGIFLSQGLALVTAQLFEVKLAAFKFIFSPQAFLKVIAYFGIAFILVIIFNALTIEKQKLIDLIYAERKNEKFKTPRLILSVFLFIVSLICLGVAYTLILNLKHFGTDAEFWISVILGCVGTFLFFFSLSGFFLKLISINKRVYLKNLNMFVLRQINSKINTTYISMTLVCLLLFVSICTLSAGMGISNAVTREQNDVTPFDATYSIGVYDYARDESGSRTYTKYYDVDIINRLKELEIDIDSFAREYAELNFYYPDISVPLAVPGDGAGYYSPAFIKLSEFNAILNMLGKEPAVLPEDGYAVVSNIPTHEQLLRDFILADSEIAIGGAVYHPGNFYQMSIQTAKSRFNIMTVIVPDAALNGFTAEHNILNIRYIKATAEYEALCLDALSETDLGYSDAHGMSLNFQTRTRVFETAKNASTMISYLAIYVGIVFLITSATVLAIAQLSEASDNISRYGLIRKLGAERRMINRALFTQILIYFGVPLILAVIHSIVGLLFATALVESFGSSRILKDGAFMAVSVIAVYGGYFAATYLGSKRIINR